MIDDSRVYPLVEVEPDALEALVRDLVGDDDGDIRRVERVEGGLTNTIHRVSLASGTKLAVKHYAGGRDAFEQELATLTLLHGTLPVPDVIKVDETGPAIVYRWIEGITMNDLRKQESPAAFASLAEPLGRLLAWLARTDATEPFELTPILDKTYTQLTQGRARHRMGAALADAIKRGLEANEPKLGWGAVCLAHGDLGARNLIVKRATGSRWRITGVIDWETCTTGSPLVDIGSLFRHTDRFDAAWAASFERGYREADGVLPEGWLLTARLLDATWIVDMLDEIRELPGAFADCRALLQKLAREL